MDFTGKCVLVTGGSRGIGRAIAEAFARHGARVGVNYKTSHKAAERIAQSLPGGPHRSWEFTASPRQPSR